MPDVPGNTKLSRRPFLAGLSALALGALAGCGSDDAERPASEGTIVSLGIIPIVDIAPVYLGLKHGFFLAEGLLLQLEALQSGAAIVTSVAGGQYHFGFSNTTSLLLAASEGLPIKAVSPGVASTGRVGKDFGAVVVKKSSSIKNAADLAGRRIAVNTLKNINTTTINQVVSEAGGDPSQITYVEYAFPAIADAVASGDVDAGQVVEPYLTEATRQKFRQVASNYASTDPNLSVGLYFTSTRYAQENAGLVTKFSTAITKSLRYANDNPDEARQVLGEYSKIDAPVQKALTLPRWSDQFDRSSIELLADLAIRDGLFDQKPDLNALLP